jgi:hypothetical protein
MSAERPGVTLAAMPPSLGLCVGFLLEPKAFDLIAEGVAEGKETPMEEGYRRGENIFPKQMMGDFTEAYDKLTSGDWADPDTTAQKLFEGVAKYDYQAVYSKFMARCIMLWLSPEEIRKNRGLGLDEEKPEISQNTERAFDVLWLAYERWMARGLGHYAEVATALSKFYAQLRWGMSLQQTAEGTPQDVEKQIAVEAYHYLVEVVSLVERSHSLFKNETEAMLRKLIEINPEIEAQESNRNKTPSVNND